MHKGTARIVVLGLMVAGLLALHIDHRLAFAADSLQIDSLSSNAKQFRNQVEQLVDKTDTLIAKLKPNPESQAVVLDLMQTRDDIMRELPKVDTAPGDAKWTAQEMIESVQSKLKLLKEQYDQAVEEG
jgi:hypothetical protein